MNSLFAFRFALTVVLPKEARKKGGGAGRELSCSLVGSVPELERLSVFALLLRIPSEASD